MKIISKWKDYYDFLVGIYGEDEKLILDRREFKKHSPDLYGSNKSKIVLHVCGREYHGLYSEGVFYYQKELKQFNDSKEHKFVWNDSELHYAIPLGGIGTNRYHYTTFLKESAVSKVNDALNCPIVIQDIFGKHRYRQHNYSKFPILKDLSFHKVISPEQMWIDLSNWLSRTKDIPNKQTDKEKIVSKGFDLKKSFRHRK